MSLATTGGSKVRAKLSCSTRDRVVRARAVGQGCVCAGAGEDPPSRGLVRDGDNRCAAVVEPGVVLPYHGDLFDCPPGPAVALIAETPFGILKAIMGLRQFLLRGLEKVNDRMALGGNRLQFDKTDTSYRDTAH